MEMLPQQVETLKLLSKGKWKINLYSNIKKALVKFALLILTEEKKIQIKSDSKY